MSRPFSSWNWPILTDIYLCDACSCHGGAIEDESGRTGVVVPRASLQLPAALVHVQAEHAHAIQPALRRCLAEEILPRFTRVFTDGNADVGLKELLEIGHFGGPPPMEIEWLVAAEAALTAAVERRIAEATTTAGGIGSG
eukprot:COSAG01_NODE_6865_length_3464_cov_50.271620_2_plen_140_part_00